jgi:hypothetical protein
MRRQTVVWKFFLPTASFFPVRIVRQVDGDVFLSATADGTSMPGTAQLRHVRRFLAQPISPQRCMKLAIAQVIRVMYKTPHLRERLQQLLEFCVQLESSNSAGGTISTPR